MTRAQLLTEVLTERFGRLGDLQHEGARRLVFMDNEWDRVRRRLALLTALDGRKGANA